MQPSTGLLRLLQQKACLDAHQRILALSLHHTFPFPCYRHHSSSCLHDSSLEGPSIVEGDQKWLEMLAMRSVTGKPQIWLILPAWAEVAHP